MPHGSLANPSSDGSFVPFRDNVLCQSRLLGMVKFKSSTFPVVEFQALGQASGCESCFKEGGHLAVHVAVVNLPQQLSAPELPCVLSYACMSTVQIEYPQNPQNEKQTRITSRWILRVCHLL